MACVKVKVYFAVYVCTMYILDIVAGWSMGLLVLVYLSETLLQSSAWVTGAGILPSIISAIFLGWYGW